MYEGNPVALQMIKTISADGVFDDADTSLSGVPLRYGRRLYLL